MPLLKHHRWQSLAPIIEKRFRVTASKLRGETIDLGRKSKCLAFPEADHSSLHAAVDAFQAFRKQRNRIFDAIASAFLQTRECMVALGFPWSCEKFLQRWASIKRMFLRLNWRTAYRVDGYASRAPAGAAVGARVKTGIMVVLRGLAQNFTSAAVGAVMVESLHAHGWDKMARKWGFNARSMVGIVAGRRLREIKLQYWNAPKWAGRGSLPTLDYLCGDDASILQEPLIDVHRSCWVRLRRGPHRVSCSRWRIAQGSC